MGNGFSTASFKTHRGKDAKRHSFLRLIEFGLFRNIVDNLSLNLRNILISPLEGDKEFLGELGELRNFKKGVNLKRSCRNSNSDLPKQLRCTLLNKFLILVKKLNQFWETVFSRFTFHVSLNRKVAFTLAEVLITLGIIGVVAALTIPNVVSNYKKKVVETRLAKLYSVLNQAVELSEEENGACTTWEWGDINNHRDSAHMEKWWKTYMADYIPNVQTVTKNSVATSSISGNGSYLVYFKDGTALKIEAIPGSYIWVVIYVKPQINTKNFNEGDVYQHDSMVSGRDYFSLYIMPSSKCSFDVNYYDNLSRNKLIEACKAPGNLGGACMKMIKDNGWKIPDDYPIKF